MTKKRGHGEGTIYKEVSGRWHGQLLLPNRKRKNVYGDTRREVQEKLAQLHREVDAGMHGTTGGDQTLTQFAADWLALHRHRLRAKTYVNYESIQKIHLDSIGDIRLNKLKPADLQAHYSRKLQRLSSTSVQHIHAYIHVVLDSAVRLGLIPRNYADFVDAPGLKPTEIEPLNESQVQTILNAVQGDPLEAAFVLALSTGMREGEFLGVRWEDIDWERGRVRVAMTVRRIKREWVFEPPKSRSSRRTLPLSDYTLAALRRRQAIQAKEREMMGQAWQDTKNLVFTTEAGSPVPAYALIERFRRLTKPVGIPVKTRLHDLRHTFATLLIERGVPIRVVSELLGHSSIAITLQIYGHVTPRMREGAYEHITDIFRLPKLEE